MREGPLYGPYRQNLIGVPASVRATLALFREFDVAATWATVGFLFARSRAERIQYSPDVRPRYANRALDPYEDETGEDEASDPLHFGASLIPLILDTPRQELSTHTFSHFYCLAEGVTAEAFRADLASARAIMQTVAGVTPRSIVFPRNEHNPAFDSILLESGITTYRGNPASWMWRPGRNNLAARGGRLLDAYVPVAGMHTVRWKDIPQPNGTYDVTASAFVRPNSRGLRLRRLIATVRHAAKHGEVAHLWWHPHNFGVRTEENLQVVRAILVELSRCREEFGMQSLTMIGAAEEAARRTASSATS